MGGYRTAMSERREDQRETDEPDRPDEEPDDEPDESGQISEVQQLDPEVAGRPVAPSDSTAGYPESESGMPDTRGSGPDAAPPENRRDNDV